MVYLIDTNIIVRFLTWDDEKLYKKSIKIFNEIEARNIDVIILDSVVAECVYVLTGFYKHPKELVSNKLKEIIMLEWVVNNNKLELIEALTLYSNENIDFVDSLIISMSNGFWYQNLSFDKKITKLTKFL